jgi:FlaA1/EpsC-like NDP-sugar epimerase
VTFNSAGFMLGWDRRLKQGAVVSIDLMIIISTVWIAFYLRLGYWIMFSPRQWVSVIAAAVIAIPALFLFGVYRAVFRHTGLATIRSITAAVTLHGLIYFLAFTLIGVPGVPRTLGIIQPILLLLALMSSRLVFSFILGDRSHLSGNKEAPRVLIYGAGSAGRQLAAAIANSNDMQTIAFLDDDRRMHGGLMVGLPIYAPDDLDALIARHRISDVLLALPSASRSRRHEIITALRSSGVGIRTLPGLLDLAHGRVTTTDLMPLEIDDLLGRGPVTPDSDLLTRNIQGKVVLVTGAGGSIGSEMCRQIMRCNPKRLLLVELSEFALYAIHHELENWTARENLGAFEIIPLLGSAHDTQWIGRVMTTWSPDTVYHAAAYKHVPLVEHNPAVGIHNNVFGTLETAIAASNAGVGKFVLVSTDKAVRPTNVMGASKRLAELVIQALAGSASTTCFCIVRFGNVLGSSGSVVPLFRRQIAEGGPITITHPDITRYFMTIPEAAQLVIQAGAMSTGGDVFVLDMGEPVRIVDLAHNMVELAGLKVRNAENPDGDIDIVAVGLRPGEKLYEELLIGSNPQRTDHVRIIKAQESHLAWAQLQPSLKQIHAAIVRNDVAATLSMLRELVVEFKPQSGIVDWQTLAEADSAVDCAERKGSATIIPISKKHSRSEPSATRHGSEI